MTLSIIDTTVYHGYLVCEARSGTFDAQSVLTELKGLDLEAVLSED